MSSQSHQEESRAPLSVCKQCFLHLLLYKRLF